MMQSKSAVRTGLLVWPISGASLFLFPFTQILPESSPWSLILASFVLAAGAAFVLDRARTRSLIENLARLGGVVVAVWLAFTLLKLLGDEPVVESLPILFPGILVLTLAVVLDMRRTVKHQRALKKLPINSAVPHERTSGDFVSARELARRVLDTR